MSYQIITYSPDTGGDEHGDYKTQREARQALKHYWQEAGALIYDLDRWRIVYRRGYWPAGALPIERGCNAYGSWETAKKILPGPSKGRYNQPANIATQYIKKEN